MNLIFKKLLLLTMQMNNANQITMKATTNKIVNLQLFSNVNIKFFVLRLTCYAFELML